MITRERARALRGLIEKAAKSLPDTDALTGIELFPTWKNDISYAVGDRVRYEETLYKCLTAHTAQESWTPAVSPSLWVRIDDPAIEWPEWVQPLGAVDAYPLGAKVSHNEKHWVSTINTNIWEPGVYGWDEV